MLTVERDDGTSVEIRFNEKYVDMFNTFVEIFHLYGLDYTFYVDDFEVRMRCREIVSDNGEDERQWKSIWPVDFVFKDGEFAIREVQDDSSKRWNDLLKRWEDK